MPNEIVTAKEVRPGKLSMLVDAPHADSLFKHLHNRNVNPSRPTGAIFEPIVLSIEGGQRRYYKTIVHEITADGTIEDFKRWTSDWNP